MNDPYKVLGIDPSATDDEVKTAYRKLSRKYHPDANINNPNKDKAEEMFKLVGQAYDQIMNERKNGYSGGSGSYSGGGYNGNPYGQYNAILLEALVVLVALMISAVPMEEIPDTVRMIHIILPLLII